MIDTPSAIGPADITDADTSPVPVATPYHRIAWAAGSRRGKPVVELVIAVALFFGFLIAVSMGVSTLSSVSFEQLLDRQGGWSIVVVGGILAMLVPAARLAARWTGRAGGLLSSVRGRLRWRWLGATMPVALAVTLCSTAISVLDAGWAVTVRDFSWPGWATFAPLAAIVLLVVPLQAAGEEYFFRGTLLQTLGVWSRSPWLPIGVSTILFALVHDLHLEGAIAVGCFGLIAGWLTIKTEGLEAALGLHIVNNVLGLWWAMAAGGAGAWMSTLNHDIDWTSVAITVATDLVYAALAVRLYRRRARRSGDLA